MPRIIALALMGLLLAAAAACAGDMPRTTMEVDGNIIAVEAPVLWADRSQGLSGRGSLAPGTGMVFAYLKPHTISMHMQGMNFPLDFVFCSDGRISQIERDVPPSMATEAVSSDHPVHLVLELAAGQADALGLRLGADCRLKMTPELRALLEKTQQN